MAYIESTELPPPGPGRDRLVAEALGCTTWSQGEGRSFWFGCHCAERRGDKPVACPHNVAIQCSEHSHAALDALKAWKRGGEGRYWSIESPDHTENRGVNMSDYTVILGVAWPGPGCIARIDAPTLGDAASAAIIEAKRRENA